MENAEIIAEMDRCIQSFANGKVSDAKNFADKVLEALFAYKRIPAIVKFIIQIKELGYPSKKLSKYEKWLERLQGGQGQEVVDLEWHLEHFKSSKEFTKKILLDEEDWNKEHFGLCYEYILRFGQDAEIFLKLSAFKQTSTDIGEEKSNNEGSITHLNYNYDQVAYELISGKKSSAEFEQNKIIAELKAIEFDNLKNEGMEMATAFRFLGMDEVVLYIGERIYSAIENIKTKASLKFLCVESLLNLGKNHQAIQTIEIFFAKEPVFGEEKLALEYLLAEAYFNLGKTAEAKKRFQEIQSKNPHYRKVFQRLKLLEAN
jgi:hypothetical protein